MTDVPPAPSDPSTPTPAHLFGEVAFQMGVLRFEQIQNALEIQKTQKTAGTDRKIGEILHERHELELRAVQKILLEQTRRRGKDIVSGVAEKKLGRFEILATLGSGGMGHVYKARDPAQQKIVALKVLSLRLTEDAEFIARFKREVETTGALSHPNIVAGYGSGSADGRPYLIMEYVEGCSLGKLLENNQHLPEKRALEIACEVARALDYAHSHGVVHRDVKPDNVIIGAGATIKLTDFGLAKLLQSDQRLTQSGIALGTPHYISPEQVAASRYIDHRADIYGLGAMLFHMLSGRVPYEGANNNEIMLKHLNTPFPDLHERVKGISAHTEWIVRKCMAKKAADRYDSAGPLIQDLTLAMNGKAPLHAQKIARDTNFKQERRGCAASIVIGVLVLLLFAMAKSFAMV